MPAVVPKQAYSRDEVCRLMDISERQLRSWVKQKFIPAGEAFSFSDLMALKTLVSLRKARVRATQIRTVLRAVRLRVTDVENPLVELKIYSEGKKICVQVGAETMEPLSGQLMLNFNASEIRKLRSFPGPSTPQNGKAIVHRNRREAEQWFEAGLKLEQAGGTFEQVVEAYSKAAELDPMSAGALVNLGTVYFNARRWAEAEEQYHKALEIDPEYALAHFNLGNLFDERGNRSKALFHYQAALRIHPNYADAHYNIALLYQASDEVLKAVRHWKAYLKIDSKSAWADIARKEFAKLRALTVVPGGSQSPGKSGK